MTDPAYQDLLKRVNSWPPRLRLALARDVLGSLRSAIPSQRGPRDTLSRALAIGRSIGEPPDDAQVRRWLDERRDEKFGS